MKGTFSVVRAWSYWRRGLVPGAIALAAQWLLREVEPGAIFLPFALVDLVIRFLPGAVATKGIELLGHHALEMAASVSILTLLVLCVLAGRRLPAIVPIGFLLATLSVATLGPVHRSLEDSFASALVAGLASAGAFLIVLPGPTLASHGVNSGRRRFLSAAAGAGVLLLVARASRNSIFGGAGDEESLAADETIERPANPAFDRIESPLRITPTADHYVVDINLEDPVIQAGDWRLDVEGAVQRPLRLSLSTLRSMHLLEQPVLLTCISNGVGGRLVGNARWTGVPLINLIKLAGPDEGASTVEIEAADGYTESYALDEVERDGALAVIGMNGRYLPREHGFPARILFPGRYGMRSVKWTSRITVGSTEDRGYWEKRGWDDDAFIRTASRVVFPGSGTPVTSPKAISGVAWCRRGGVSAVEFAIDDQDAWVQAEVEDRAGPFAWTRWKAQVTLAPGAHSLTVRATDGDGILQDPTRRLPHPSGASGYHRVTICAL